MITLTFIFKIFVISIAALAVIAVIMTIANKFFNRATERSERKMFSGSIRH